MMMMIMHMHLNCSNFSLTHLGSSPELYSAIRKSEIAKETGHLEQKLLSLGLKITITLKKIPHVDDDDCTQEITQVKIKHSLMMMIQNSLLLSVVLQYFL